MNKTEFTEITGIELSTEEFDIVGWAYNRSGMSNVAFGQTVSELTEEGEKIGHLLSILGGIKARVEDKMARTDGLEDLVYIYSQKFLDNIDQAAELYGKIAYVARALMEGDTLTPGLKDYMLELLRRS